MNRIFLSLYLLIVLSIVFLGWGADRLWQAYAPDPQVTPVEKAIFELVDQTVMFPEASLENNFSIIELDSVNIKYGPLEMLASSSLADRINGGEIIALYSSDGYKHLYKKHEKTDNFIHIVSNERVSSRDTNYLIILVGFYCLIALMVYFWVWPLTRDLSRLQKQTRFLGKDGIPQDISIGRRSAIYSLVKSFNHMSSRIRSLIQSHKDMTSAVSHELRTPLARMKFAIEIAEPKDVNQVVSAQLSSIKQDVEEMDALINGLLHYAGYEHYSQILEMKPVALYPFVKKIVAKNISQSNVECNLSNHLSIEQVNCEWTLMERAIHNVVQNAVTHAKHKIEITLLNVGEQITVIADDDGEGIAVENRTKVLQPYTRLPNQNKKSGFGLGLAIVNRIITWHHGVVTIGDSPLGGARFSLSWPNQG